MSSWGSGLRGGSTLGSVSSPVAQSGSAAAESAIGARSAGVAGSPGARGAVDPLRKFADFCDRFPVHAPSEAIVPGAPKTRSEHMVTVAEDARAAPAVAPGAVDSGDDGGGAQGGRTEQSRRAAKETAAKSYQVLRRHKVEQWAQLADKHNRRLRKENEVLAKIATVTQEAALNNDDRYDEAVAALRAQVEYTSLYRSADSDTMAFVRESMADIRDRMSEVLDANQGQVQAELSNIRESFERQVQLRDAELEQARASEQDTTEEWRRHSRELQDQLDVLLRDTDTAFGRHKRLQKEHQRLRIENDAQADDAVLLGRQWNLVSSQHQRLRDRVQELELELAGVNNNNHQPHSGGGPQGTPQPGPQGTDANRVLVPDRAPGEGDEDHVKRLAAALARGSALLAAERDSLDAVRAAHVGALQQRTELEVYLRCAVLQHQRNLATAHYAERQNRGGAASGGWGTGGAGARAGTASSAAKADTHGEGAEHAAAVSTSFTADDRRVVVESLLSVPRVLQLLYRAGTTTDEQVPPSNDRARQRSPPGGGETTQSLSQRAGLRSDLVAMGMPSAAIDRAAAAADPDEHRFTDPAGANGVVGGGDAGESGVDEAALARMWERWQQWTSEAQRALAQRRPDGVAL